MTDKEKPTRSAGGQLTANKNSRPCDLHEFTQRFIFWGGSVSLINWMKLLFFFFFLLLPQKFELILITHLSVTPGIQESAHAGDSLGSTSTRKPAFCLSCFHLSSRFSPCVRHAWYAVFVFTRASDTYSTFV